MHDTTHAQEEDTRHMEHVLARLSASNKHVHTTMGSLLHADSLPGIHMLTGCPDMASLTGDRKDPRGYAPCTQVFGVALHACP
jgi:hypothetical protein